MKNGMNKTLLRAIGMVALFSASCGANDPGGTGTETNTSCLGDSTGGACSITNTNTNTNTVSTTGTNTNTSTATNTNTNTVSTTNTGTTTNTDTLTSTLPSWCNYGLYPTNPAAGNPLSYSVISTGTWHTMQGNYEWVLNCKVDNKGNTKCCGTLLAEAGNINALSLSLWGGFSMEHCIIWGDGQTDVTTGAPSIGATGYKVNSDATRIDLTGATAPTWLTANRTAIVACGN